MFKCLAYFACPADPGIQTGNFFFTSPVFWPLTLSSLHQQTAAHSGVRRGSVRLQKSAAATRGRVQIPRNRWRRLDETWHWLHRWVPSCPVCVVEVMWTRPFAGRWAPFPGVFRCNLKGFLCWGSPMSQSDGIILIRCWILNTTRLSWVVLYFYPNSQTPAPQIWTFVGFLSCFGKTNYLIILTWAVFSLFFWHFKDVTFNQLFERINYGWRLWNRCWKALKQTHQLT